MTSPAPGKARTKKSPKAAPVTPAQPEVDTDELSDEELAALARAMPSEDGPIAEDGSIRPVQIGKRGRTPNEMTTIFTLDGTDYAIPAKPSPALVLKWMRACRVPKGAGKAKAKAIVYAATEDVLMTLLGQEALDALAESPDVTNDDMADIFAIVGTIFFGARAALMKTTADPS